MMCHSCPSTFLKFKTSKNGSKSPYPMPSQKKCTTGHRRFGLIAKVSWELPFPAAVTDPTGPKPRHQTRKLPPLDGGRPSEAPQESILSTSCGQQISRLRFQTSSLQT